MGTENPAPPKKFLPPVAHSKYFNVTQIVHKGACLVCSVTVSSSAEAGSVLIYDGLNANGELKCRIEVIANTTFRWCLPFPTDFDRGIYITVNDNTTYVTIQWIPEDWHDYI